MGSLLNRGARKERLLASSMRPTPSPRILEGGYLLVTAANRVQVFDQDGNFLEEWKQFGRRSGMFIERNDNIYVADSQSDAKRNPGVMRGIRIGSVKDGAVKTLISGLGADQENQSVGEGVAADAMGNVYWTETSGMTVRKFVKK